MGALKDGRYPIQLDKERHLLYSLNVMDKLEEKYGDSEKIPELMQGNGKISFIRWFLTELLNEGATANEDIVGEKDVGKLIHAGNLNYVIATMFKACSYGMGGTDEPPQDNILDREEAEEQEENPRIGQASN
jgi:hypothetical protein